MKLLLSLTLAFACISCGKAPDDYQLEIAGLESKLGELRRAHASESGERDAMREIYLRYTLASLTGDYRHFKEVENAIAAAFGKYGASEQLLLFRADFNFKMHRLDAAIRDLKSLSTFSRNPQIEILTADVAMQKGRYKVAVAMLERNLAARKDWINLARMASWRGSSGQPEEADRLYAVAQEKLSTKEMRHYAWLELQRGLLDLDRGRQREALEHYQRADRAYAGYWLIEEHIAEVTALLGRRGEAIELYRQVIEKSPRPDLISALASLVEDEQTAAGLSERADRAFARDMALFPEAATGHLIRYLLGRERVAPKLLSYAHRNYELRPNSESRYLLARSLHRVGSVQDATHLMEAVLRSPWRKPEAVDFARQLGLRAD